MKSREQVQVQGKTTRKARKPRSKKSASAFAVRLSLLMERAGITTKRGLMKAARISAMSLHRYEQGERLPPSNVAAAMADALGCSVDELLGRVPIGHRDIKPENVVLADREAAAKITATVERYEDEVRELTADTAQISVNTADTVVQMLGASAVGDRAARLERTLRLYVDEVARLRRLRAEDLRIVRIATRMALGPKGSNAEFARLQAELLETSRDVARARLERACMEADEPDYLTALRAEGIEVDAFLDRLAAKIDDVADKARSMHGRITKMLDTLDGSPS